MCDYDIEKMINRFHVQPIMTRGNRKGVIFKFPYYYLKIYDGSKQMQYSVQVWNYGKQLPTIVQDMSIQELIKFCSYNH